MTRYHARVDANAAAIVQAWKSVGAFVMDLSPLGKNRPDKLVWFQGRTLLVEIKNPKGRNRVSAGQQAWLDRYPGEKAIVRSIDEALSVIGCKG